MEQESTGGMGTGHDTSLYFHIMSPLLWNDWNS